MDSAMLRGAIGHIGQHVDYAPIDQRSVRRFRSGNGVR
jgi:hypothetical protein